MWKLKVDAEGKPVLKNGLPTWIKEDNSEVEIDPEKQFETVGRLMGESKTHREAAEAANTKLKEIPEGFDIKAAKAALETVKAFTGKQAVDAAELERHRAEAAKAVEDKYAPLVGENKGLKGQLQQVTIGHAFANSKFIKEKIAENIPVGMLQSTYGNSFEMKEGVGIVGKRADGNPIYSMADPSKLATFDEAFEIIVKGDPYSAQLMRGTGIGGSGSQGGNGGTGGKGADGRPTMLRSAFTALSAAEQPNAVKTHSIIDG